MSSDLLLPTAIFETFSTSNYSNPSTNDSTICHPLLLGQGSTSEKGLCDDSTSAVVISAIVLFIHTALLLVSVGALIYKLRKLHILQKEHNQVVNYLQIARNPALMIMGAIIGWTYTFVLMTRVLIGRKIYPCFIFSLIYYLAVPALSNTVILRCFRLLILTKLYELKVRIGNRQHELRISISSDNTKPVITDPNETTKQSSSTTEQLAKSETSLNTGEIEQRSSMSTFSNSTSLSQVNSTAVILEDDKLDMEILFRSKTKWEIFEKRLFTLFRFLVGTKFIFFVYGFIVALHMIIYYIIAIADYFRYHDNYLDTDQIRNNFAVYSYLLSPSGCGTGSYSQYVFISYAAFYLVWALLASVIALFTKRDVWNVKIEVIVISVFWVLVIILYGVGSQFSIINSYVDYIFPWSITILIGCMWDTFLSLTYPVFFLQRFKSEPKVDKTQKPNSTELAETNSESNIRKILLNEKWNNLFLKFSEKCFACEDIMMWNAIEKFRAIKSEKQRNELFYNICNAYIRTGAPLELNISRKDFGIPEIMKTFEFLKERAISGGSPSDSPKKQTFSITSNMFDKIQTACENNMLDNYTRFQASNQKQLEKELGILSVMKV